MRINTNLSALNAYRNLNITDSRLNKSLERLSSGLRINRAADDAAGLAISEKMRGQIRGLNQAMRNAQDGISLMQTAEGALNENHSILQRMRELAVQAASDTLTSSDRIEIQREIDQLKGEMDRIASSTEFNTKKLLDGSSAALTSTSDLNTKVFMRGGLRTIDQFGQKAVGGGNYKLEIDAIAGKGEVQKTDIMKVKHEKNVIDIGGTNGGLRAVMRYAIDMTQDGFSAGITIALNSGSTGTTLSASLTSSTVTVNFDPAAHTVKDIYDQLKALTAGITLADGVLSSGATLAFNELFDFQLIDGAMNVATAGGTNSGITDVGWFVGNLASVETEIRDIDRFWDANGNFIAEDPQTINIVQGNGKQTTITIFGSDTIQNIEDKLNRAIHNELGQREFSNESDAYVKFVSEVAATESGNFSVGGTFVIQSAVTGKDGELRFSGNEGIINALSLTTIQKSKENEFTVSVYDAHTEKVVAQDERIVGNMLVGVVHENVDVKFDPMAGVQVVVDGNKNFDWTGSHEDENVDTTTIFIHLSDNTMIFHIGANPLQDVGAAIGDMSSEALGVDNILVTNRESANRALSQIDYAIANVSSERAKLGAVQNRLEHTINNLAVAAENLTAAESRVRDLDFAMEMVEFTRNQIMMQAGTSMLAQANMKPQSVLMLLQ